MVYGRKLQAEAGRLETRVKISEMRRCCTVVSCGAERWVLAIRLARNMWALWVGTYELGVEFRETWLAGIVEDENGVDHGGQWQVSRV